MERPVIRPIFLLVVVMLLLWSVVACGGPDEDRATEAGQPSGATDSAGMVISGTSQPGDPGATSPAVTGGTGQVAPANGTAVVSTDPAAMSSPVITPAQQGAAIGEPTVPAATTPQVQLDPTQVYSTPEIPDPTPAQNGNPEPAEGVLPGHRVISFYGHPNSELMGILGEHATKEEALAHLQQIVAEYQTADPATPVLPAFELIATVAQPDPGEDGDYLADTDPEIIQEYVDFTAANNMLLILDVQIGHDSVPNQVHKMREYLKYPHVHLALDPEFQTIASQAVPVDRAPGEFIGETNGHDVNIAIQMLSDLVTEFNLPRKMLIVHQFEMEMLYNKYVITPQPGVDFVLDMDGFGGSEAKTSNYDYYVRQELIEYGGIKLFFQQDAPLMTPAEVVALEPSPLVVIYQ